MLKLTCQQAAFLRLPPHAASLTCRKRGEHDPAVERLCAAIVVLQQHLVCVCGLTGVKCRLHFQELWKEGFGGFFFFYILN